MTLFRSRSFLIATLFLSILLSAGTTNAQEADGVTRSDTVGTTAVPSVDNSRSGSAADLNSSLTMTRVGVQTAQPLPLTLSDAIGRALTNNNDIEVSRTTVRIQEQAVKAQKGIFDPVVTINPVYSRNSTTGSSATNDFRLSSDLSKFIKPGGGNYSVFFNNNRTENAFAQAQVTSGSVTSSSSAIYSSSLGVSYTQPLLRNFNIDSRRQQLKIAKKRLEQNDSDFRLQALRTISSVQSAYWDLVFALRNQQNVSANVNLARENLRQIEARIEAGAAAPLDKASVETELANRESDLLLATQQVTTAENSLKQLILRDPLAVEWSETIVPTDQPTVAGAPANLDAAMQKAMDNRYELKRLKLAADINEIDQKYFKNQTRPQIDLNTTFSLDGLSRGGTNSEFTTNLITGSADIFLLNSINSTRTALSLPPIVNPTVVVPASPAFLFGGFNRSLSNIFRSDAPNFSVGVTISFPLRNRTAEANYAASKITGEQIDAQTRAQEQTVIVEVRNAVQAVETARQRVLTARRARENAEIQLEGERSLYNAGRSTTFLLFQRENALANARNAEIRAETDYKKAIADLQRVTATSFEENNIVIDSPVDIK